MSLTVKLSDERGTQLEAYAASHGLGMAEAIGSLLRHAGAVDRIPGLDCYAIKPDRSKFVVLIDSIGIFAEPQSVLTIADTIDRICIPGTVPQRIEMGRSVKKTELGTLGKRMIIGRGDEKTELLVARNRGNASIVMLARDLAKGTEVRRVIPTDIARDFAEHLRKAVLRR